MWEAKIRKVDNGFVFSYEEESTLNGETTLMLKREILFEENVDEDNKDHVVNLLYQVLEHFGEEGSKHDKERIRIEVQKNEGC
jgi:poly(A) polymerase Pap1